MQVSLDMSDGSDADAIRGVLNGMHMQHMQPRALEGALAQTKTEAEAETDNTAGPAPDRARAEVTSRPTIAGTATGIERIHGVSLAQQHGEDHHASLASSSSGSDDSDSDSDSGEEQNWSPKGFWAQGRDFTAARKAWEQNASTPRGASLLDTGSRTSPDTAAAPAVQDMHGDTPHRERGEVGEDNGTGWRSDSDEGAPSASTPPRPQESPSAQQERSTSASTPLTSFHSVAFSGWHPSSTELGGYPLVFAAPRRKWWRQRAAKGCDDNAAGGIRR